MTIEITSSDTTNGTAEYGRGVHEGAIATTQGNRNRSYVSAPYRDIQSGVVVKIGSDQVEKFRLKLGFTGNDVQIQTEETRGGLHGSFGFYELSPDLQFRRFSLGVGYWKLHKLLELEGKVKHGVEKCPDRTGPKVVRMWTPEIGWQEISVPSVLLSP